MELIPVWNGTLEHDRRAPGLSNYLGRSSLHHSASWAQGEGLEYGECAPVGPASDKPRPAYLPRLAHPRLSPERAQAVAVLLRKGVSLRRLARDFGVTIAQARRVAREIGLVRAAA